MARPLILSLDGQEFPVSLVKIDRDDLYGSIEIEAFDERGNEASLKVLAADGKTLIDKGGTALLTLNEDGDSISRTDLQPINEDGDPIEKVPSSFDQTNVLSPATPDDYFTQIVRSIYLLQPSDGERLDYLQDHLDGEQIYKFDFSYRGGVDHDSAFIVGSKRDAFMVVGKQARIEFVKLNQAAVLDAPEEQQLAAEDIDFELL